MEKESGARFLAFSIFVWYAVCLIFLTSPNDCRLFPLRDLIEFTWQISHSTETPLLQELEKYKIEALLKLVFLFICEVIICT